MTPQEENQKMRELLKRVTESPRVIVGQAFVKDKAAHHYLVSSTVTDEIDEFLKNDN